MISYLENKVIVKIILWVAICFPIVHTFAQQNTFVKSFRLYDQSKHETGQSLFAHRNAIFINSGTICNSKACGWYAKFDEKGTIQWKRGHLWTGSANDNTFSINNGTLYIGSHSNNLDPFYHMIKINPRNGDSIRHFTYDLTESSPTGVALNGVVIHNGDILLYGESVRSGGKSKGIIQWVDTSGMALRQKLYPVAPDNQNGVDRVENLQPDSTGNLVYITQTRKNFVEYSVIRKIDPNGEIIRELSLEAGSNQSGHLPIMTVDKRGNYVLEHRIKIDLSSHLQLLCVDTLGKTVWEYTLRDLSAGPERPERYDYHKIKGTSDGGVIAVGRVQSYVLQKAYYEDALLLKLDKNGKKEWERRINVKDSNDSLLNFCGLFDVVQTDDGGYAAVGFNKYSHVSGLQDVLMVKMDKNGCISGYDCSKDTIILRSSLVSLDDANHFLSKINVHPNPFYDHVTISNLSPAIQQVYITDIMGNVVYKNNIDAATENLQVEGSSWPPGLYIVSGRDMFGHVVDRKKIIKN